MTSAGESNAALNGGPFLVAGWRIEPESNCLIRGAEVRRVEPKAMQVLVYMASRAAQVVTREELEDAIWVDMVVGPDALTNSIIKLRKALGDNARDARFIETIPKRGYRLIAPVRPATDGDSEPSLKRKLSAVLYADVAGYSRLTGENEERTHRALSVCLDLFSDTIRAHGGSVVHYAGDAVLAEFATVTEALSCAVEVQRELRALGASNPDAAPVQFRIGINLGEVIVDRDDIYGDGVNIAARLEGLAEPGGICISESVRTAVGTKLPLDYQFMGEQPVKNIAEPVRAYRVLFYPSTQRAAPRYRRSTIVGLSAAGLLMVAAVGAIVWQKASLPTARLEQRMVVAPASDKPTIAVLPFANVSVDSGDEYLADGMTDDIITDLSKVSGLYVIARSSAFTYKNQAINVADIGRELNAQYVLEGSIRKTLDRVRINIQLVDAKTGRHLWGERYEGAYSEFFALQDQVIGKVVSAVSVTLTDAELTRIERPRTASLEAYDYYLRAQQAGYIGGVSDLHDTMALYAKAISLDPEFADAHAGLARAAVEMWRQDVSDVMPGAEARRRAYESASRALEIDPGNAKAYSVLAVLQLADGQHDAAIESARKAVALEPGSAEAHLDLGLVLAYSGESRPGVASIETALRLNPRPTPDALLYAGIVFFIDGQYVRAIDSLWRAKAERDGTEPVWTFLAAAFAEAGRTSDAREALAGLLDRYPNMSTAYYRVRDSYFRRDQDFERLLTGLRTAGLPEWPYAFQGPVSDRLGADDLAAVTLGKTWSGKHQNGVPFIQEVSATGELAYRSQNSFQTGHVSIRGESLCQRFDGVTLNKYLCGHVYRNRSGSSQTQDEFISVMPDSLRYFSLVSQ